MVRDTLCDSSDGGCSSGVEHLVVIQDVAGSNPVSRPFRPNRRRTPTTGSAAFCIPAADTQKAESMM
jgi:hypothetical protein